MQSYITYLRQNKKTMEILIFPACESCLFWNFVLPQFCCPMVYLYFIRIKAIQTRKERFWAKNNLICTYIDTQNLFQCNKKHIWKVKYTNNLLQRNQKTMKILIYPACESCLELCKNGSPQFCCSMLYSCFIGFCLPLTEYQKGFHEVHLGQN